MITIIHGENIAVSRKYFSDRKTSSKSPLVLEGTSITVTDLTQAIEGQGLFGEKQDIFIEEFFSKRKPSKETDALFTYILEHQKNQSITIWESKSVTPSQIKLLKNVDLKKFDFPKTLFSFLESIKPDNSQTAIQLFHKTTETEEVEFVYFMIVRHIRILLAISEMNTIDVIDEVKRLAPWQKGKLEKQMRAFGLNRLIQFFNKLFVIEQEMKTGKLSVPLDQAIDFLLLDL